MTPRSRNRNAILVAVLGVIIFLLVLMTLAIIAAKNDGTLALDRLPEQVTVALFSEEEEGTEADDPEALFLTLEKGYKLPSKDGTPVLVVKGTIENKGNMVRTRIVLKGSVVTADGAVQFETRAPCGKVFANRRLRKTARGRYSKLFVRHKELIDCTLNPGEKRPFQMIFDTIPKDYEDAYTVKVTPLLSGKEEVDILSNTLSKQQPKKRNKRKKKAVERPLQPVE